MMERLFGDAILAFCGQFLTFYVSQSCMLVTSFFFLVLLWYGRSRSTSSPRFRATALVGEYVSGVIFRWLFISGVVHYLRFSCSCIGEFNEMCFYYSAHSLINSFTLNTRVSEGRIIKFCRSNHCMQFYIFVYDNTFVDNFLPTSEHRFEGIYCCFFNAYGADGLTECDWHALIC